MIKIYQFDVNEIFMSKVGFHACQKKLVDSLGFSPTQFILSVTLLNKSIICLQGKIKKEQSKHVSKMLVHKYI